ncbi:MAG: hypothetical protein K2W96_27855 [Gemmataceae bacterium]|nr:hypothetical protein [Gemmataceae bacterium]
MRKADWLACADPARMLGPAFKSASPRKRRLFAVAGARLSWRLLEDERSREAVEVAERFADGEADDRERAAAGTGASRAQYDIWTALGGSARREEDSEGWYASLWAVWASGAVEAQYHRINSLARRGVPPAAQAVLLRDLFRRSKRKPRLGRVGPDAERIARYAYGEKDWAVLPVLADALEDDGWPDTDLLAHLRSPGHHVRGCWALDLVLGKG